MDNIDDLDGIFDGVLDADEMATVLGMAEEIAELESLSSDDNEDNIEMVSLFVDDHIRRHERNRIRKPAPKDSFEAWVRDVCAGRKSVNDPL